MQLKALLSRAQHAADRLWGAKRAAGPDVEDALWHDASSPAVDDASGAASVGLSASSSAPSAPSDVEIRGYIRASISARLKRELAIADDEQPFSALGLDSISLLELGAGLEKRFGVTLADFAAYEHPTPAALARHIAELLRVEIGPTAQSNAPAPLTPPASAGGNLMLPVWRPSSSS